MAFKMLATVRAPPTRRSGGRRRNIGLLLDQLIELRQRGLRHFVQRCDAHQHFGAQLFGQQRHDGGRLLGLEVREHDRRDLRMFAADDLRHRLGFHPLQRLDALAGLAGRDPVEQHVGLLLADGLGQHAPHIVREPPARFALPSAMPMNFSSTEVICSRDISLSSAMAMPNFCTSRGIQLLEQIGGVLLAQAHQQDGGALRSGKFVGLVSHPRRPSPSRLARHAEDPGPPRFAPPRSAAQNWAQV
jgi:hypothetical protein